MNAPTKRIFSFGPFLLDPEEHTLLREGAPISLKPRVFDLLLIFLENPGRLLAKEELIGRLWAQVAVEDHNLAVAVHELRKALGDTSNSGQPHYIETVPRIGYRFGVTVEMTDVARVAAINNTTAAPEETKSHHHAWTRRIIITLAVLAGVIILIVIWQRPFSKSRTSYPFQNTHITRLTNTGNIKDAKVSLDGKYLAYIQMSSDKSSLRVREISTQKDVELLPQTQSSGGYMGVTFSPKDNSIYFLRWEKEDDAAELRSIPVTGGESHKVLDKLSSPISFSPDGERFVFMRRYTDPRRAVLIIANKDGTGEQPLAVRNSPQFISNAAPAWSPDGNVVACITGGPDKGDFFDIVAIRVSDGVEQLISTKTLKRVVSIGWLPDSSGLIASGVDEKPGFAQQLWHLSYPDGKAQRITHDLNNYQHVTVTQDARTMVTVQSESFFDIWVKGITDDDTGVQLSAGRFDGRDGISWTPDNKIIYISEVGDSQSILLMSSSGADRRVVNNGGLFRSPNACPDNHTFVFTEQSAGASHVWKMSFDGGNKQQLTNGSGEQWPQCSPDGKFVVYFARDEAGQLTLWKLSLDRGVPERIVNLLTRTPAISPNGERVAFLYSQDGRWRIGIFLLENGKLAQSLEMPSNIDPNWAIPMKWSADGKSLLYVDHPSDSVSNIWILPLAGGEPRQLTKFQERRIYSFDVSRTDGRLVFSCGHDVRDALLITSQ